MKRTRFFFRVISLLLCLLFSSGFVSCSGDAEKSIERDEILEHFREKLSETAPSSTDTVFWTKGGTVYHLYDDCRFLLRSDEIRSGTLAHCGRSRLCDACEQRSQESTCVSEGSSGSIGTEDSYESVGSEAITGGSEVVTDESETMISKTTADSTDTASPISTTMSPTEVTPGTTAVDNIPGTVYWTPKGKVWHADANCPSLARSKVVKSGTIEQSGKVRGCSKCS